MPPIRLLCIVAAVPAALPSLLLLTSFWTRSLAIGFVGVRDQSLNRKESLWIYYLSLSLSLSFSFSLSNMTIYIYIYEFTFLHVFYFKTFFPSANPLWNGASYARRSRQHDYKLRSVRIREILDILGGDIENDCIMGNGEIWLSLSRWIICKHSPRLVTCGLTETACVLSRKGSVVYLRWSTSWKIKCTRYSLAFSSLSLSLCVCVCVSVCLSVSPIPFIRFIYLTWNRLCHFVESRRSGPFRGKKCLSHSSAALIKRPSPTSSTDLTFIAAWLGDWLSNQLSISIIPASCFATRDVDSAKGLLERLDDEFPRGKRDCCISNGETFYPSLERGERGERERERSE